MLGRTVRFRLARFPRPGPVPNRIRSGLMTFSDYVEPV
jgi:hypothetical protein